MDLKQELKDRFGFKGFRGEQEAVIQRALAGEHSLVLMPTGMGKSLCYQLPSLMQEGLTLVISPLIALMEDQLYKARERGIRAVAIHSNLRREDRTEAYERLRRGDCQLALVTPERFRKQEFLGAVTSRPIALLAVDEAHCISEWGHDFRPDYTRLAEFRKILGEPVTMALTATATPEVQEDIVGQLGLAAEEVKIFKSGLERDNLNIEVHDLYGLDQKIQQIVALRHQFPGPAIVYCSLISTLQKISEQLDRLSLEHLIYHGQMNAGGRKSQQKKFIKGEAPLILATPAFGLGVDKPNVRLLVHAEIPGSIESYYQEIGRAGRDGAPAQCSVLFDQDDISIQMDFLKWANPEPSFIESVYQLIQDYPARVDAEGLDFIREKLNFYNRRDFRVETAVNLLERWGSIEVSNHGRTLRAISEPEGEWLAQEHYEVRLKKQQQKLLQLVQLLQLDRPGEYLPEIYRYFGA